MIEEITQRIPADAEERIRAAGQRIIEARRQAEHLAATVDQSCSDMAQEIERLSHALGPQVSDATGEIMVPAIAGGASHAVQLWLDARFEDDFRNQVIRPAMRWVRKRETAPESARSRQVMLSLAVVPPAPAATKQPRPLVTPPPYQRHALELLKWLRAQRSLETSAQLDLRPVAIELQRLGLTGPSRQSAAPV